MNDLFKVVVVVVVLMLVLMLMFVRDSKQRFAVDYTFKQRTRNE